MLQVKNISKIYVTEDLKQTALNDVSICFRVNEFVSVLGPSGSGKTTLLNIIGGLDYYDKGDLIINEVSTKKYNDRDWDSYRNHRIGFVFQSYNLIAHQSILHNVELALTLSGVSKAERIRRAKRALKEVGLEKHINKRPNQLSGGQMQRVAIARALVNNPDILLADEPTGALDSETSKQIMDLLKKVAKDKLVIMVTHNPELAVEYSTRIIKLKDGKVIDDSNPYQGEVDTREDEERRNIKSKRTSMSLMTALSLSLNNLMTKKWRTFLTAFAGSIGIIGIALILSLSSGVQDYIDKTQKETLSSYPLSIEDSTMDFSSMVEKVAKVAENEVVCENGKICTVDDITISPSLTLTTAVIKNDLKSFKEALDDNYQEINNYVTDIQYMYDLDLQIYSDNIDGGALQINPNSFDVNTIGFDQTIDMNAVYGNMEMTSSSAYMSIDVFKQLINNDDLLAGQYDLLSGEMPNRYNEMVLIVDENNQLPLSVMYSLDVENRSNIADIVKRIKAGEEVSLDSINYDYNQFVGKKFKLVLGTDYYTKEGSSWKSHKDDKEYMKNLVSSAEEVEIVGVIKVADDAVDATSGYVGYTHELIEYVIKKVNRTEIAKQQLANKDVNVFTGEPFDLLTSNYEANLHQLGISDISSPQIINIYPKDYEAKEQIENIIKKYNEENTEEKQIVYTDYVGILMSGITTIVDVIAYVLVAFVAISLVVSSIMIAIITYISVLERTKEIGILRSIGASKKDITRVFNAETIIEGLVAGVFGVVVTVLLNIPVNIIVGNLTGVKNISSLPVFSGFVLVFISVFLTVIAGLIPSRIAAKKDPVEALRSE